MTADFTNSGTSNAITIGNLNNKIVDNENVYTASATTNSFKSQKMASIK
ncbi:hypothetical protein PFY10_19545 [Chryseobacterium daecheongense]|nr:hypothetical protein PFY10_19545 [Chryseobacterium daecheongense]